MPEAPQPRIAQDVKYVRPTTARDRGKALGLSILGNEGRKIVEGADRTKTKIKDVPQQILDFADGVSRRLNRPEADWRDEAVVHVNKANAKDGQKAVESFGSRDKAGKLVLSTEEQKLKVETEGNRLLYIDYVNNGFDNLKDDPIAMKTLQNGSPNPNYRTAQQKKDAVIAKIRADISQNPRLKDVWADIEGDPAAEQKLLERIAQDRRYQAKVGEGLNAVKDAAVDRNPVEEAREAFEDAEEDLEALTEELQSIEGERNDIVNRYSSGQSMTTLRDSAQGEVSVLSQQLASLRAKDSSSTLVVNVTQPGAPGGGARVISPEEMRLIGELKDANKRLADASRYIQITGKGEGSISKIKRELSKAERKKVKAELKKQEEEVTFKKTQENLANTYDQIGAQAVESWAESEANEHSSSLDNLIAETEDPRTKALYEGFKSHWQKKGTIILGKRIIVGRQQDSKHVKDDFKGLMGNPPPTAEDLIKDVLTDSRVINPDTGFPYKVDPANNINQIEDRLKDKAWVEAVAPQVVVEMVRRLRTQRRLNHSELQTLNKRYPGVWEAAVSRDQEMAAKVAYEAGMMKAEGVDAPNYVQRVGNLLATNPNMANRYLSVLNTPAQFFALFSSMGKAFGQDEEAALEAAAAAEQGLLRKAA